MLANIDLCLSYVIKRELMLIGHVRLIRVIFMRKLTTKLARSCQQTLSNPHDTF